uniref:Uncharacterized protein n=1 Tax=Vespula pensylvanica TaxID=30213 RepID=A0A834KHZ2_VESPE|nr:hypothetical protein H0235_015080 [Vespula pensylvanica]
MGKGRGGEGGEEDVGVEIARRGRGKERGRVDVDVWRVDSNICNGVGVGVGIGVGVGVGRTIENDNDDDDDDDDDYDEDDDDDEDDGLLEIGKEFFEEIHENVNVYWRSLRRNYDHFGIRSYDHVYEKKKMTPNISNEQALNIYKEKIVRSNLVPFLFQRLLTERSPTEPRDPLLLGELKNVCVCTACHRNDGSISASCNVSSSSNSNSSNGSSSKSKSSSSNINGSSTSRLME